MNDLRIIGAACANTLYCCYSLTFQNLSICDYCNHMIILYDHTIQRMFQIFQTFQNLILGITLVPLLDHICYRLNYKLSIYSTLVPPAVASHQLD